MNNHDSKERDAEGNSQNMNKKTWQTPAILADEEFEIGAAVCDGTTTDATVKWADDGVNCRTAQRS